MARTKKKQTDSDAEPGDGGDVGASQVNSSADADGPEKPPAGSRSSAAKEVIPFEWKLVGEADGFALTLFKSVEREDVDAQFERIQRDGYYTNLRILAADDKVTQPTSLKARRARKAAKISVGQEASGKSPSPRGANGKAADRSSRTGRSPARRKASSAGSRRDKAKRTAKTAPKAKTRAKGKSAKSAKTAGKITRNRKKRKTR